MMGANYFKKRELADPKESPLKMHKPPAHPSLSTQVKYSGSNPNHQASHSSLGANHDKIVGFYKNMLKQLKETMAQEKPTPKNF